MSPRSATSTLNIVIAGDASGARKAIGQTETATKSLGSTMKGIGAKIGGALAVGAVVAAGQRAISTYREVGGEMLKLQRLTGASEDVVSGLWVGAQQSGIAFDKLSSSIGILSTKISNGAVEDLGFQVRDATGAALPFNQILGQIMDRFQSMENGTEKNALARQLFGRSGTDLIPLLNKGSESLDGFIDRAEQLGISLNSADIKQATKNQRDFQLALTAAGYTVGKELLPKLTEFTSIAANNLPAIAQAAGAVAGAFNRLPGPLQALAISGIGLGPLASRISNIGAAASAASSGLRTAAGSATAMNAAIATSAAADGVSKTRASVDMLKASLSGSAAAAGSTTTALAGMAAFAVGFAATMKAGDALQNTNEIGASVGRLEVALQALADSGEVEGALADYGAGFERLASDINRVDEANISRIFTAPGAVLSGRYDAAAQNINAVDSALASMVASGNGPAAASAFQQISAGLEAQGISAADVTQAFPNYTNAVEDAQIAGTDQAAASEEQATELDYLKEEVRDANEVYQQWRATIESTTQAQQDAANSLRDAQRGARDAHLATLDAQQELADAQAAANGDSEEYRDAIQAEVDAREALVDAQNSERDAQLALNEAREEAAVKIRDLAQAAREAALDEEGASIALEKARQELARAQADASTTPLEMRELQLAVREAEANLAAAHNQTGDAAREAADAQAAGVEGSPGVIAAKEALADAADGVRDAEMRVTQAQRDQVKVIEDAKKRARDAARKLEDAVLDESEAWGDLAGAVGTSKDNVDAQITSLENLLTTIEPGSPLRVAILTLINDLRQINGISPQYSTMGYDEWLLNYLAQGGREEDAPEAYLNRPRTVGRGQKALPTSAGTKPVVLNLNQTVNGSSLEVARRAKADGEALLDAAARLVG